MTEINADSPKSIDDDILAATEKYARRQKTITALKRVGLMIAAGTAAYVTVKAAAEKFNEKFDNETETD